MRPFRKCQFKYNLPLCASEVVLGTVNNPYHQITSSNHHTLMTTSYLEISRFRSMLAAYILLFSWGL